MSLLLNPKLWIAAGITALIVFLYLDIQAKKVTIATLEGDKAVLTQENQDLGKQIINLASIITTLKANLEAAKKSIKEMQAIKDEANVLRRRIIELQNKPGACEEIKNEYQKISSDITLLFNDRVQRKISVPKPDGDRTAPQILPGPVAPDVGRPQGNAGAAG
jgi:DNA repair exonuclease SbcCD ATPase subunit